MEDLPLELGAFGYLVHCTKNTYCVLKDLEHRYVWLQLTRANPMLHP